MRLETVLQTYEETSNLSVSPELVRDLDTITFEAWARWNGALPQDQSQAFMRLLSIVCAEGRHFRVNQALGQDFRSLHAKLTVGETTVTPVRDSEVDFSKWHHVAVVAGSGGHKLYRNGELVHTSEIPFRIEEFEPVSTIRMGIVRDTDSTTQGDDLARDRAGTMDEIPEGHPWRGGVVYGHDHQS